MSLHSNPYQVTDLGNAHVATAAGVLPCVIWNARLSMQGQGPSASAVRPCRAGDLCLARSPAIAQPVEFGARTV